MQLSRDTGNGKYQIQAYQDGCIIVNGERYPHSILIMPENLINSWGPTTLGSITKEHFEMLIPLKPEVVLLGTGKKQKMPSMEIFIPLIEQGIGFEVMDTGAACRTYTLLMIEGRRVAAALLTG